jgi:hypothetical protein
VHEPDDEFIRLPARVEDKGDHYSVTLTDPKVRGMENLTTEQLLDLLQPGRELVLGADGVFDVVEPDGEQDHRADVSACPVRLTETRRRFARLTEDDRLIVSEPFSDLPGVWHEIPEATAAIVPPGGVLEKQPFKPTTDDAGLTAGAGTT